MKTYFRHDLIHLNDLAELSDAVYPSSEIANEKYLQWEYRSNPDGEAIVFVVSENDKPVSQYVLLPRNITGITNENLKGTLSVNTLTHPDHRGKGHFVNLAQLNYDFCRENNFDFTIGFPNKNSVAGFLLKLNFSLIGRLPLFLKILNLPGALHGFLFRKAEHNKEILLNFKDIPGISRFNPERDRTEYILFWNEFKKRNCFTSERSPEFILWRYVNIPIRNYYLFKIETQGKIDAILVLRAKNIRGVRCGIIVDCLALNNNDKVKLLLKQFAENDLHLIISTVPEFSVESKILRSGGFFVVPDLLMFKKLNMIIRFHTDKMKSSLIDFKKWFITFGDYDIF